MHWLKKYLSLIHILKNYIEMSQLGDICNIAKDKEDIVEYAKTYR